ncbi:MAG: acyl-CoA desaturase [Bacteroidota bacterium]|nr:acyl-CoA desaturase [Bacteroidota bacterium]
MNTKAKVKFGGRERSQFYPTLKKRIDQYFIDNNISKHANSAMVIKTIVMFAMYIVPFIVLLAVQPGVGISMLLWTIMGFGVAGIGMSVMHDGNHGAYSGNDRVNYLIGHAVNLLGGSAYNWKVQHNVLHHTYTNIRHMDEDIDDKPMLRFSPHAKVKFYHRLQWIYAFFFYGILTLYWVVAKDFVQYAKYTREGLAAASTQKNIIILLKIIAVKLIYFFIIIAVPVLFFGLPLLPVIAGFLIMHFIAGLVLTTTFQLAHSVEGTTHPLPDEKGNIENEWAIHQLNTTVNFSPKNKLLSWYVGGLNFQVEHHLFPTISHVHYPKIAGIVKATAEEFNVPYLENKTVGKALRSHISALQTYGRMPDLNEAIG